MIIIQLEKSIVELEGKEIIERIIIIDDNEDICNTLSLILEDEGYKTEIALTGQKAINKIINKFYNVALLDINLPDVKGTELITSIKEIHPNMDIIMLTANTSSKLVIDALNKGASSYILKPFTNDNLIINIKSKLERQRLILEKQQTEQRLKESEQKYRNLSNDLEKKVMERTKELKKSEEKFRKMISELDVGYYIIGLDGKFLFHNSAFNKIGGYDVSENFIGKIGKDFWVNPLELKHYMEQIFKKGYIENFIARVKKKNDEGIFIELNSHLVRNDKDKPTSIEGTFIDVTQKFEYEQKLKEQNLRLKEINEFKTNLLNRTSHELQTPLISILGFTDIILNKYKGKLDPDLIVDLKIINKKANHLTRIIRSLIDTAYLEKDILQINVYKDDLALLIRDCVKNFNPLLKLRNLSINASIHDILITNFDNSTIYRVFESLLENAINNTPSEGKIEVRSKVKEGFYIISIKDNGVGLLKEEQEQLFQPFGKIERYGKGNDIVIDGSGLSLYISKKIIELHGGKIGVKSKGRNMGSTFFFSLPIVND